ncbi:YceD family protein [Staphylococcus pseudintermedius]|uniref:YceD family protein n=1 Tax=Staphylococcus pseudintermedius TaxID=283734 RepID=UPI002A4E1294|nr:YceD family protein [Staphylococcus pseudintermedius]WQJ44017.1 YceD family protein [Staphylococcus pseudintermedius]WQJ46374.1 YceD family protein [Staphylococcus pseudintermedius]
MKWSITQLRKYQGQLFKFNQTVTFNHLIQNLDLLDLSPIDIEGELIVKSNEVVATMHLTGQYKMACARTLVPVDVPLDATTTEVFDLDGLYEDEDDEHYHLVTNGMIDLREIAEEIVMLEKPMRVVADDSDQMLTGGQGWEVIDEDNLDNDPSQDESHVNVDPRLQKLQQLYDDSNHAR